jgi:hypothetical protein
MSLFDLLDAEPPALPSRTASPDTGTLHYRYFPAVSAPGQSDIAQAVLTPAGGHEFEYLAFQRGQGRVEFIHSSWEQLPTMFQIVNTLAALPILEYRGATCSRTLGTKDLSDQRVLV